jgi:hypothetical protein
MTVINSRDVTSVCGDKQKSDGRELQRTLRHSVSAALEVRQKGHGLHGMVLAIRDALAQGDKSDELAAKIDKALDAASKHLAEQGYSPDEIAAAVQRFRGRLAHEIDALASKTPAKGDAAAAGAAQSVAVAEAAREVKRERFSLDILTTEGDKVSIRFKSLNVTEVAAAQVSNDSGTTTAVEAHVISRGRFKVEVDGDLNDAERAAIGNLLDKVDDIATDFFGGDVQAAFSAAARVGLDSDTLSAFSLRMSYSKSMAAAQAYAKTAALPTSATPAQAPATTPTTTTTTTTTTPAAETPAPAKVADVAPATTASESTTPAPAPATDAPSARQTIASFAKDVLARLSTAGENSSAKFSLRWKVEFLLTAIESVSTTPAQTETTDALGQALGSSAA